MAQIKPKASTFVAPRPDGPNWEIVLSTLQTIGSGADLAGQGITHVRLDHGGAVRITLLMEFEGGVADLEAAGVQVLARAGSLFAVEAPLDEIKRSLDSTAQSALRIIFKSHALRRASMGRPLRPAAAGAVETLGRKEPVRRLARCPANRPSPAGRGVTIGSLDTMFDYAHPDLWPAGSPWTNDKIPQPGLRVCTLFDSFSMQAADTSRLLADIEDAWRTGATRTFAIGQRDPVAAGESTLERIDVFRTHGTHAIGLAAGSGNASIGRAFAGIAPQAELMLACAGLQDNATVADTRDVLLAVRYLVEENRAPLVLLLNFGDCLGAHDGTLLGEQFLDEVLLQPGRTVVLPAGNQHTAWQRAEGQAPLAPHRRIPGRGDSPRTVRLGFCYRAASTKADAIEIWFRADGQPSARIDLPETVAQPWSLAKLAFGAPGEKSWLVLSFTAADGGRCTAVGSLGLSETPGLWRLRLFLWPIPDRSTQAPSMHPLPAQWRFTIDGAVGDVHAWCDWNNETERDWDFPLPPDGDDRCTLTTPATARRVIVAAACDDLVDGSYRPAAYSGRGPTRDGRRKPDVCAIGSGIAAASYRPSPISRRQLPDNPKFLQRDEYRSTVSGTSFTAPQVAGLAALLLQRWGEAATWADVRQAIVEGAVRPQHWASSAPDPHDNAPLIRPHDKDEAAEGALPPEPGLRAFAWDPANGYGRIDVTRTLFPPRPLHDIYIASASADRGAEPFVAPTLWPGSGIRVEEQPDGGWIIAVRVRNRGWERMEGAKLHLFAAPLGALHPLPSLKLGDGVTPVFNAWRSLIPDAPEPVPAVQGSADDAVEDAGVEVRVAVRAATIDSLLPDRRNACAIAAVIDHPKDPYEPEATLGMRNNIAVICRAFCPLVNGALLLPPRFTIIGSDDVDSLMLWAEGISGEVVLSGLPVTALPWRTLRLFTEDPDSYLSGNGVRSGRERPYLGQDQDHRDPANRLDFVRENVPPEKIGDLTDVEGAAALRVDAPTDPSLYALTSITVAPGATLWLPRLRIAEGFRLDTLVVSVTGAALTGEEGKLHLVHFSGGRRVGGGTIAVR